MRLILAVIAAAALAATPTIAGTHGSLHVLRAAPLTLNGTGFAPRERVRLTIYAAHATTVRPVADAQGQLLAHFPFAVSPCTLWVARAVGSSTGTITYLAPKGRCATGQQLVGTGLAVKSPAARSPPPASPNSPATDQHRTSPSRSQSTVSPTPTPPPVPTAASPSPCPQATTPSPSPAAPRRRPWASGRVTYPAPGSTSTPGSANEARCGGGRRRGLSRSGLLRDPSHSCNVATGAGGPAGAARE